MSFDPFGQIPGPAPPSQPPADADELPEDEDDEIRERVQFPAMFLIATAVLNLLVALFQVGVFVAVVVTPAEPLRRFWIERLEPIEKEPNAPMAEMMKQTLENARNSEPGAFKRQSIIREGITAALLMTVSVLGLLGGLRMYQLRAYSMAMVGSLATAVPCLSPMTCCCLGELVAAWCVMILLLPSVRDAFR